MSTKVNFWMGFTVENKIRKRIKEAAYILVPKPHRKQITDTIFIAMNNEISGIVNKFQKCYNKSK